MRRMMRLYELNNDHDDQSSKLRKDVRLNKGKNIKRIKKDNNPADLEEPNIKMDGEPQLIGQAPL